MEKICSKCKKSKPKTNIYFHNKYVKQYSKTEGVFKTYNSLRHICKECHNEINKINIINKLNKTSTKEERENARKEKQRIRLLKIKDAIVLTRNERTCLNKNIEKGYKYNGIEQFLKDRKDNIFTIKRVQKIFKITDNYQKYIELPKAEKKYLKNIYINKTLTDGLVANRLRLKKDNCPKSLIDNHRLIIQINQIIKNK